MPNTGKQSLQAAVYATTCCISEKQIQESERFSICPKCGKIASWFLVNPISIRGIRVLPSSAVVKQQTKVSHRGARPAQAGVGGRGRVNDSQTCGGMPALTPLKKL